MRDDLSALRVALDRVPAPPFDGETFDARRVRVERFERRRKFALVACAAFALPTIAAAFLLFFNNLEAARNGVEAQSTPAGVTNDAFGFAGYGRSRAPQDLRGLPPDLRDLLTPPNGRGFPSNVRNLPPNVRSLPPNVRIIQIAPR
jgi:hypothetical protein